MMNQIQLEVHAQVEDERRKRIQHAWQAYHGDSPKPLRPTKSDPRAEDNVRLNFGRLVVDKGVSFLFGSELCFEVDPSDNAEAEEGKESKADLWLEKCWAANRKMTTLHRLGINGGVTGDVFLKLKAADPLRGKPFPRVVVLDPQNVQVRVRADDWEEVDSYLIQWHGVDPGSNPPVAVAYRQTIQRDGNAWVITDEESRGNVAAWKQTAEERWPYPWSPVLHCQNLPSPNEYYGLSDLEPAVLEANGAINFVVSNLNRIIRIHAHPKTWGRGFAATEMKIGVDEMIVLPSEEGELQNLEMLSDLSSSLAHLAQLKDAYHEITRIPAVATGKVENLGQLSGLALRILYGPLVELTETKRLVYGEMLQELCNRLLELGGFGGEHEIKLQWSSVTPTDQQADATTATLWDQLGVSKDTILTKLGFDPEVEEQKRSEEAAEAGNVGNVLLQQFDKGQAVPGNPAPEKLPVAPMAGSKQ